MKTRKFIVCLIISFFFGVGFSQEYDCIPERPNPPRLVNDLANIIPDQSENQIEQKLAQFSRQTSNQIAVVTVDSFCGDKALFTYQIGEKWGVGNKKFDNGIVIMIKPKKTNEAGHAFVAVGYGLEGAIPDATAKLIVDNEMIPAFKENNYALGVAKASDVLMKIAEGEFSSKQYNDKVANGGNIIVSIIVIGLFILIFIISKVSQAKRHAIGHNTSFWTALLLMSTMNGGGFRGGGGFNDFTSGGGGFGGFGGGGFGGGGAGGSW